jgi:molybdenum cofactor cytidylyltransferase
MMSVGDHKGRPYNKSIFSGTRAIRESPIRYGFVFPVGATLAVAQKRRPVMTIPCILLAAGLSRRFGSNKLLYPVEGRPLYRHTMDKLTALRDGDPERYPLYLVSRWPEILTEGRKQGWTVLDHPHSEAGLSSTLQLGLRAALEHAGPEDAFAFFVCDQPWLRLETIRAFLDGFENSGKGLGCLQCGGTPGNPAVFSQAYVPELLALTGDHGGRRVLNAHPEDLYLHPAAPEELRDVDIPPLSCPLS